MWAARALLYVWDEAVVPEVVRALGHEHWRLREMAAKVVAKREVGAAADAVRALLDDEDEAVRKRAEQSLARMERRLDRDLDDT